MITNRNTPRNSQVRFARRGFVVISLYFQQIPPKVSPGAFRALEICSIYFVGSTNTPKTFPRRDSRAGNCSNSFVFQQIPPKKFPSAFRAPELCRIPLYFNKSTGFPGSASRAKNYLPKSHVYIIIVFHVFRRCRFIIILAPDRASKG